MLSNIITSFIVLSSVLQVTLPVAVDTHAYPVPTVVSKNTKQSEPLTQTSEDFEWRVLKRLYGEYDVPPPIKKTQSVDPAIAAKAAIILDGKSQHVLWQKNPDAQVPVASITKLMTALVWFDHLPPEGMSHVHTFAPEEDQPEGKELDLPHGSQLRAGDLLKGAMVGSNNDMIVALAHTTPIRDAEYIELMNKKAEALGMHGTRFADMTGLSDNDISTAPDIARLAQAAFWNEGIQGPAGQTEHLQETTDGKIKNTIYTTNKLLYDNTLDVVAGKTGYTTAAGYCLVVKVIVPESAGGDGEKYVIAVVLGAHSDNERFAQTKKLLDWAFKEFHWDVQE